MTIQEFSLLDDTAKEEMIWDHATFIVNYDEGNMMCDVYELFEFYVAFCYKLHKNLKASIKAAVYPHELIELVAEKS